MLTGEAAAPQNEVRGPAWQELAEKLPDDLQRFLDHK
jgi:hypothetical protein